MRRIAISKTLTDMSTQGAHAGKKCGRVVFYIYLPENRKREFHSEYEKMSHKRVMPETENRFGHFLCFGWNRSAQQGWCFRFKRTFCEFILPCCGEVHNGGKV